MDDYSFGYEYRARITELQDIAAMDRLAAQLAPASRLRRYAESTGPAGDTGWSALMARLRRVLGGRQVRHGHENVASQL